MSKPITEKLNKKLQLLADSAFISVNICGSGIFHNMRLLRNHRLTKHILN